MSAGIGYAFGFAVGVALVGFLILVAGAIADWVQGKLEIWGHRQWCRNTLASLPSGGIACASIVHDTDGYMVRWHGTEEAILSAYHKSQQTPEAWMVEVGHIGEGLWGLGTRYIRDPLTSPTSLTGSR